MIMYKNIVLVLGEQKTDNQFIVLFTKNKSLILALNECLEFVLYMQACSKCRLWWRKGE